MRQMKAIVLLVLALLCGLAAALYTAGWLTQKGRVAANKVQVAAVDIELGSRIGQQMLTSVDWPAGAVPPGAFANATDLQDRVAKVGILRGEPILEGKLAPVGTLGGLSAVIAEGKRAMTVRVNDVVGVAGFALPGNYVDVVVNTQRDRVGKEMGKEEDKQISKTVLEHVLVLAVAQEAGRDDTKPKVVSAVTLELTPGESEMLDLARSVGALSLVLRNQSDKNPVRTVGATKRDLFGMKEAPVPVLAKAAAPRPVHRESVPAGPCVEVFQDGGRVLNCFK
jgi:pilus assembly protein CpaB